MGIEYIQNDAIIDGMYRYALTRRWKTPGLGIMWIMLNPSTADANEDDNTIPKVVKISKNHGFGEYYGWNELVKGGVEVHYVPGSHRGILQEPNVEMVADKLRDYIYTE